MSFTKLIIYIFFLVTYYRILQTIYLHQLLVSLDCLGHKKFKQTNSHQVSFREFPN